MKWKKPAQNWENIVKYRLYYQQLYYGPPVQQQFNDTSGEQILDSSSSYQALLQYDDEETNEAISNEPESQSDYVDADSSSKN